MTHQHTEPDGRPTIPPSAAASGSGSGSATGGWESGSIAVIIGVNHASTKLNRAATPGAPPAVWNLKGLRHAGTAAGNRLSQPNVVAWNPISDARITATQHGASYALFQDRGQPKNAQAAAENGGPDGADQPTGATTHAEPLPAAIHDTEYTENWNPSAIELFSFPSDTPAGGEPLTYVVLHLLAKPAALRDITAAVGYLSAPYTLADQSRGRLPAKKLNALLKQLGFPAGATTSRPYILTHLVPEQTLPDAESELLGARERGWTTEQVWAWRLAGGPNLTVDTEPGWDPAAPTRNGFWSGSTWCRVDTLGAAFVGTRGLDELPTTDTHEGQVWWRPQRQYIEHVRLEAYTHRTAVDLAILAMRHARFLDAHATALASALALPTHSTGSETSLARGGTGAGSQGEALTQRLRDLHQARHSALDLELSLIAFRNDLWFTHVPGDATVTATLAGFHETFGALRLLDEISDEQSDLTRILGLAADEAAAALSRAQHEAAVAAKEAAQSTQRATEEQQRILAQRRTLLDRIITFVAPLIAVPGAVLAYVQVFQSSEGKRIDLWVGSGVIAVLCLLSWFVLWMLLLRDAKTPGTTSTRAAVSSAAGAAAGGAGATSAPAKK